MLTLDDAQTIVWANPAMAALLGRSAADLVGAPFARLIAPHGRAACERYLRARAAGTPDPQRPARSRKLSVLRADGTEFAVDADFSRLTLAGGERVSTLILRAAARAGTPAKALRARDSHAELRRLMVWKDRIQEGERKRIARELHDDLQQSLAAIRSNLTALLQAPPLPADEVAVLLEETHMLAGAALEATRRSIDELRPQMLEDLGLRPALESLASRFARRNGIDCRFIAAYDLPADEAFPPELATCLYRVAQEALANVIKHAHATQVRIGMRPAPGGVLLRIADDGRGMSAGAQKKPSAFGLLGMRERVQAVGGVLRIESAPQIGTRIEAIVPLPGTGTHRAADRAEN